MVKYSSPKLGQPVQMTETAALPRPTRLPRDCLALKDWVSGSFLLLSDRAHFNNGSFPAFADNPMRYSRLSTAHLHPEERGFGCGCAAAPGSLVPAVPNWLQPSTPGSIPPGSIPSPQQLLITKILNLTSALVSIKIRSLISPCRSVPPLQSPPRPYLELTHNLFGLCTNCSTDGISRHLQMDLWNSFFCACIDHPIPWLWKIETVTQEHDVLMTDMEDKVPTWQHLHIQFRYWKPLCLARKKKRL